MSSFVLVWSFLVIEYLSALEIYRGYKNYSTYYEGNSPIIILSQHGGYIYPSDMPNRTNGCWNYTSKQCIWQYDCQQNTIYNQSAEECDVKTIRDAYTKEIATCLTNNIDIFGNNRSNIPHLVVNELYREKLDPNREIGEATLGNDQAIQVYNDIHFNFMTKAKNKTMNQCGFGLVFDIHGQSRNLFNQLGYRLNDGNLESDDQILNEELDSSSIFSLVLNNIQNDTLSEIVRGVHSLGTIMNETYGYLIVPSTLVPYLDTEYYYQGGFGILEHGSQYGGNVDAIQIEVNYANRWISENRQQFCIDFSRAIEQFVNHYYNLSKCSGVEGYNPTMITTENPATTSITDLSTSISSSTGKTTDDSSTSSTLGQSTQDSSTSADSFFRKIGALVLCIITFFIVL